PRLELAKQGAIRKIVLQKRVECHCDGDAGQYFPQGLTRTAGDAGETAEPSNKKAADETAYMGRDVDAKERGEAEDEAVDSPTLVIGAHGAGQGIVPTQAHGEHDAYKSEASGGCTHRQALRRPDNAEPEAREGGEHISDDETAGAI